MQDKNKLDGWRGIEILLCWIGFICFIMAAVHYGWSDYPPLH